MRPEDVGRALAVRPGIVEVHDLHVWEVTVGLPRARRARARRAGRRLPRAPRASSSALHERFGIDHTTLQVDHEAAQQLLDIEDRR